MIYAVIDVGSNSIRLSVYEIDEERYSRIYAGKKIAGLASYISKGELSEGGIQRAIEVLNEYKTLLNNSAVTKVSVFATAALRNIKNSAEAVAAIENETGYSIDVISGHEEAAFGYYGASADCDAESGILVDIGGGSTEVVFFNNRKIEKAQSIPLGSLNLFSKYVSELLPKEKELRSLNDLIKTSLLESEITTYPRSENLYGIGGTARATVKLANRLFSLDSANRTITARQLKELRKLLCGGTEVARNLIIKTCPERIHTIVPGIVILDCIAKQTKAKRLTISRYGVREGYLCQRVMGKQL